MKKIIYACFAAMLIAIILSGCGKEPIHYEWKDLKEVADSFSLEDAKSAGYAVMEDGDVTFGEDIWQEFVDLSEDKTPCKVRVAHYYTIGDPSHYDPAYYESIKDEYPKLYIFEIDYNGETFSESHYEEERFYQSEYKYLMKYEGEAETFSASYTSYIRYVLVNDNTVTWNDIAHGMLSSQFGAYIPHSTVYTDLILEGEDK